MPIYNPTKFGAVCGACPISKLNNWNPIQSHIVQNPVAQIIGINPHPKAQWSTNSSGPMMDRVWVALQRNGLKKTEVNYVYRNSCVFPNKGIPKSAKTKASKCCAPHAEYWFKKDLPTLYLGKDATSGFLGLEERQSASYCLEYGKPVMVVDQLSTPYSAAPGRIAFYEEMIGRWCYAVLGKYKPEPWPEIIIEPSERALEALRNMGPDLAWDIETQGINPLVVPTTCIGVSDVKTAVCLPWDYYYSTNWGAVEPLESYGELGIALRAEMLRLLTSNRRMFTQNGNYDVTGLLPKGHAVRNDVDIYNLHALLFPAMKHDLETIARHCMHLEYRWKHFYKKGINLKYNKTGENHLMYEGGHPMDLRDYCARDCYTTLTSGLRLLNKIESL